MSDFKQRFTKVINKLALSDTERELITSRYINIVTTTEANYRRVFVLYILLSNLVTIAGVLITALVSLDAVNVYSKAAFFWVIWGLSIALTLSNKWLYSFEIHKKYNKLATILEKFYSEGWSFASGVGKYASGDIHARYKLFCARVERIKMKTVEIGSGDEKTAEILAAGSSVDEHSESEEKKGDENV